MSFAAKFTYILTILVKDGGSTRALKRFSSIDYNVQTLWADSRPVGLSPKFSDSAM